MSTTRTGRTKSDVGKARGTALTMADLVVLSLISEKPMHGYEVVKEYERQEVADWASVSRPHVYYALQKLAACGHIAAVASSATPDPRRKAVYRITQAGGQALNVALSSNQWAQNRTPTTFNTWLGLAIHAGLAERRCVLAARRQYLQEQIAKERRTAGEIGADPSSRARIAAVMVGLCIEQFELELRWLARLEDVLLTA